MSPTAPDTATNPATHLATFQPARLRPRAALPPRSALFPTRRSSRPPTAALRLSALALLLLTVLAAPPSARATTDALCGTTVTADLTLTEDVDCTGYTGTALTIAASGITIDGAGFRLLAPDASAAIVIDPAVNDVTIANIDVLGWCNGTGISITGGSGHVLSNIRADSRSIGIDARNTTNLTLTDIAIDAAAQIAIALDNITLPLNLSNLQLTNSAIGLTLKSIAGPLVIDATALPRITGHDVGIRFISDVSNITLSGLTVDGLDFGIDASDASLAGLVFDDLDLSCPMGTGTGLALAGSNHIVNDVLIERRAIGLSAASAANLAIDGLTVSGATDTALRITAPTGTLTLADLSLRHSFRGLALTDYTPATRVTFSGLDPETGAGTFRTLSENDTGLALVNVANVTFAGFASEAITTSIDASATTNANLIFRNLDLSTARRGGTGLLLAGTNQTVENLVANDLTVGVNAIGVTGLTLNGIAAGRASTSGVRIENPSGAVTLRNLSLTDCHQGLTLVNFAGTQATPRIIDRWNATAQTGTIASVSGSATGIHATNTRDVIFENLILPNRDAGLYGRDSSNTRLTVRNSDFSGPGAGIGLDLSGASHTISNIASNDRTTGIFVTAASGIAFNGVQSMRCTSGALSINNFNSTHTPPTYANLDLRNNIRALSFSGNSRVMTFSGTGGIDVAGSAIGITIQSTSNLTVEDLRLDTTRFGVDAVPTTNTNNTLTFRRVDASGSGTGTGFSVRGSTHRFIDVVANDRTTGVSVTQATGLVVDGLVARRNADVALVIDGVATPATAPSLADLDLRDNLTALRLTAVTSAITLNENTNLDVTGSHVGLDFQNSANHVVRNLTLRTTGVGVQALSGNSALTLTNLDVSGYGLGTGIRLGDSISNSANLAAGSNHIVTDITVSDRETGLWLINPDAIQLRRISFFNNGIGLALRGFGASFPGTLGAPTLDSLSFSNNQTAIVLADVRVALTLDGTTQVLSFSNNDRGIVIDRSQTIIARNMTIPSREVAILAGDGNGSLTFRDLDLSGDGQGIGLQLGTDAYAANTALRAGTGHVLERITASDRATGVLVLGATTLSLVDVTAARATDRAVRLVNTTRPLTLTRLSLTDSRIGLELETLAGTSSTPFQIRGVAGAAPSAAISSLAGCDTGIVLTSTQHLLISDLVLDNRTAAITATSGNSNLTFRDLTLDGPGAGFGLRVAGATHTLTRVSANLRDIGISLEGTTGATLGDVTARRCATHGVHVATAVHPIAITNLRVSDSATGLRIQNVSGTGTLALNAAAIADLSGNNTAIHLTDATGVSVDGTGLGLTVSSGQWKTAAPAQNALCGTTVNANLTLTADLACPATTGTVLTVGADDITIDGAGFRIIAPHATSVVNAFNRNRIVVRNLDVSGTYAANDGIVIDGGTGHAVRDVTASLRGRGVVLRSTNDITLATLVANRTTTTAFLLDTIARPLSLANLAATDGHGAGLSLRAFDGNPTDAPGGNFIVDAAAITSLANHDLSIHVDGTVTDVDFRDLPALDGRTFGIDATATNNSRLTFANLNVSGRLATGTGLATVGNNHTFTTVTSNRRATGFDIRSGQNLSLTALTALRSSTAGIRLQAVSSPLTLTNLTAERGATGLLVTATTRTAGTPLVLDPFTAGAGAIASLARNAVSLQVDNSAHITVSGLTLDGTTSGLRATTSVSNLTATGVTASATHGGGTGFDIAGANHTLTNTLARRRATGYNLRNTTNLVVTNADASGSTLKGFAFFTPGVLTGLDNLAAPYSAIGIELDTVVGTASVPRILTGRDPVLLVGAVGDMAGVDTGIAITNSSHLKLSGVRVGGRAHGINAGLAGNSFVTVEASDLSFGPAVGNGVSLSGADHRVVDSTIRRRTSGISATSAARLALSNLTIEGAATTGISIGSTAPPLTLERLRINRAAEGLTLSSVVGTVSVPLTITRWTAATPGTIETFSGNLVDLRLVGSQYISVVGTTHNAENHGILATGTGTSLNRNLTLQDLVLDGPGSGVGLQLQGSGAALGNVLTNIRAHLRTTGVILDNASGTVTNLAANRNATGLTLQNYGSTNIPPTLVGLDLRDNGRGLSFASFARTSQTTFGEALALDTAGSDTGVELDGSSRRITLQDLTIQGRSTGIVMGTSTSDCTFERLDLRGPGVGLGINFRGPRNVVRDVDVSRRSVGLSGTSVFGGEQTIDGLVAEQSAIGLSFDNIASSQVVPVVTRLSVKNSTVGMNLSQMRRAMTFDGASGYDFTGTVTGVRFQTSSADTTLRNFAIPSLANAVDIPTANDRHVFQNIDVTGFGRGTGFAVQSGVGHRFEDVIIKAREAGFSSTGAGGAVFAGAIIEGISGPAVSMAQVKAPLTPPSFEDVSIASAVAALRFTAMDGPFTISGTGLVNLANNRTGVDYVSGVQRVTLRNISSRASVAGIAAKGVDNHANIFEDIDVTGQCRGTGITLSGADNTVDRLLVSKRVTAVEADGVAGLRLRQSAVGGSQSGVRVLGTAAVVNTTVVTSASNSTTRVQVGSVANIYIGQSLNIGANQRTVTAISGNLVTFSPGVTSTPSVGTTVRSVTFNQPAGVISNTDVCANGTGLASGSISVTATTNYWRDKTGPTHTSNTNGKGDRVTGTAVTLSPWALVPADKATPFCNSAPVPAVAPPAIVCEGETVTLDASGSTDPDEEPITFQWLQVEGQPITLAGATTAKPTFTAPGPTDIPGEDPGPEDLTFRVLVRDDYLTRSAEQTVTIYRLNRPAIVDPGEDRQVPENSAVTLDATGTVDPEGGDLSYTWTQVEGPAVTLAGANTATPTFTSPNLDVGGGPASVLLKFRVAVDDALLPFYCGNAQPATGDVVVEVVNVNKLPVPAINADQSVCAGDLVTVTAAGTTDADGDPISYAWTHVSGPAVTLAGANTDTATFTAPTPTGAATPSPNPDVHTLRVDIADGYGTGQATTTVTVQRRNTAPIAEAGPNANAIEGTDVTLDAGQSQDLEGGTLAYAWEQVSGPAVTLAGADTANPTFTAPLLNLGGADIAVPVVFRVTTTDTVQTGVCGVAQTATDTVTIDIRNLNTRPSASAGEAQTVCENDPVSLDATASLDADDDPLTFRWTQTGGQTVTLQNATQRIATFIAPTPTGPGGVDPSPETLSFQVAVDDSFFTSTATTTVTIERRNRAPVAIGGSGATLDEGGTVDLDAGASSDPEGGSLAFAWTQVDGTPAQIDDPTSPAPTITTPLLDVGGGPIQDTLVFEVAVTDTVLDGRCGSPLTTTARVEIRVDNVNRTPTADAGETQITLSGRNVSLDASASTDPDGDTLQYQWEQVSGIPATLSGATTARPSFITPPRGENDSEFMVFRVIVDDGFGGTDTAEVTIILGRPCSSAADCGDANECTEDFCLEAGYCAWQPRPARFACGDGWLCDGANTCVECLEQNDCVDPWTCTIDSCVSFSCSYSAQPEGYPCEVGTCSGILAEPACVPDVSTWVTITRPALNSFIRESDVIVTGTGEPGSSLEVTLNDRIDPRRRDLRTTTIANDGSWSVIFPNKADGGYSVLAEVTDIFGNIGEDGPIPFVVDTRAPKIAITAPSNDALLASGTIVVVGKADRNSPIRVEVDGLLAGTTTADGNGNWQVAVPNILADGPHLAVATTNDPAGNNARDDANFVVDTIAPTLTILSPTDNPVLSQRTLDVQGEGEVGASIAVVIFHADEDPDAPAANNTDEFGRYKTIVDDEGAWLVGTETMPDGKYRIEATATDDAGNTSAPETARFEISSKAPDLVIERPVAGLLTNDVTPTIAGTTDPRATLLIEIVDADGAVQRTQTTTAPDDVGAFTWDVDPALEDGMWAVRVVATGANGFTTEASAGFQTDASAPVFTVTQPAVDAVMDDRFVTITGTAEPRTQLTLYVDNIEVATFNTYENSDWTHPLTSALENGDHTLFVIARDAAGNSADLTVPFKVLWYDELNGGDGGSGDFNGAEVNERSDGCAGGNEGPMGAWLLMLGAVLVLVRRRRHG